MTDIAISRILTNWVMKRNGNFGNGYFWRIFIPVEKRKMALKTAILTTMKTFNIRKKMTRIKLMKTSQKVGRDIATMVLQKTKRLVEKTMTRISWWKKRGGDKQILDVRNVIWKISGMIKPLHALTKVVLKFSFIANQFVTCYTTTISFWNIRLWLYNKSCDIHDLNKK